MEVSSLLCAWRPPHPRPLSHQGRGGLLLKHLRQAPLLPWWEKVGAQRSDEGSAAGALAC